MIAFCSSVFSVKGAEATAIRAAPRSGIGASLQDTWAWRDKLARTPADRPGLADCERVNFALDLLQAQPQDRLVLVELARDGARREWSFGDVERYSAAMAGAFVRHGLRRGDVMMTLIGNRPEWEFAMMACFRTGA
ncbi:MAG TPA: AMP-binding protein, partial [Solirubrobacteraceae bacterium]|nr:AMP-binding protein [Solirubrobacteraceae bacterium]